MSRGTPSAPRILVLGAGSAGARHARHLATRGAEVYVTDLDPARAERIRHATPIEYDLGVLHRFDAVVIASPNAAHEEQALRSIEAGRLALVEKPLATSGTAATRLAEEGGDQLMVAYNLRLHAPVERLVQLVHTGRVGAIHSVRLWFGYYLPAWRPAVDYRTTYSAQSALGGGVLLDAIHELDLLLWLVGHGSTVVGAFVGSVGDLDIDVEDTVRCVLCTPAGAPVELSLDYLSRRYRRGIEVVGSAATVRLDWARSVLEIEDGDGMTSEDASIPVEASYERQADRFLEWIRNGVAPPVVGREGAASVVLADQIRAAAR